MSDSRPVSGSSLARTIPSKISVNTSDDIRLAALTRTFLGKFFRQHRHAQEPTPKQCYQQSKHQTKPQSGSSQRDDSRLIASGMSVHSAQAAKSLASARHRLNYLPWAGSNPTSQL
ncbi:hypothetical protein PI124_g15251 [Phytophthora idaei]|nr:hypothetical protein PI124_g15251 [Phytophthora idaei]